MSKSQSKKRSHQRKNKNKPKVNKKTVTVRQNKRYRDQSSNTKSQNDKYKSQFKSQEQLKALRKISLKDTLIRLPIYSQELLISYRLISTTPSVGTIKSIL